MSSARLPCKMRVAKIRDLTPEIRELCLEAFEPSEFKFRAGQFGMLHVPAEPKAQLRAYSYASDERNTKGFRLVFKTVPNGVASNYVWSLKGSEILNFTGPFGRLFFHEPPTEQIIFLNTGSGVSQHICYLESKKDQYPDLKYRLLFGVRTEKDIYYRPELEALKKSLKNFSYDFVLSRGSESWQGLRGYVQNHIQELNYTTVPTTFYMCGNGAMIKDVKSILGASGFDKTRIHAEAFD